MTAVKAKRVAEMIAGTLRRDILERRLTDQLPKEEVLRERFDTGKTSMREALLILQSEGLIEIRRGKVGGSDICLPSVGSVSAKLSRVLASDSVSIGELIAAINILEPKCAVAFAARSDRAPLADLLAKEATRMSENLDDGLKQVQAYQAFRDFMVENCGDKALTMVTQAVTQIWREHESRWASLAVGRGQFPPLETRRRAAESLHKTVELLRAGDPSVEAQRSQHLKETISNLPEGVADTRVMVTGASGESGFKPQRVAEMIAGTLREEILSRALVGQLPKEDELRERFGTGKTSMREALLILQSEGLIEIRRGKVGGSDIHLPSSESVATAMGFVLIAERVTVGELMSALQMLVPQCARTLALADDRDDTVELLRAQADRMRERLSDRLEEMAAYGEYRRLLVDRCDNGVLRVVAGAVVQLWGYNEQRWAARGAGVALSEEEMALRRHAADALDRTTDLIAEGDTEASKFLAAHIEESFEPVNDMSRAMTIDSSFLS